MITFKVLHTFLCALVTTSFHAIPTEDKPLRSQAAPQVTLDSGTFTGTSVENVNKFLGIPFGESTAPPNRFQLPIPVPEYTGSHDATSFGPACPQQDQRRNCPLSVLRCALKDRPKHVLELPQQTVIQVVDDETSEDCLSVNVITPTGVAPDSNLPVVAWIYGGAFEDGESSGTNDGSRLVSRSIYLGQPIIFVSMNYRVSAWGFLASQEVKDAGVGNLGLQDQRLALKWVQKYISNFGGDPTKVTIWGESAGSISVSLHMLANGGNTEGLFRGAFMQSGSPTPVGDITNGQVHYDALVQETGCSESTDTLDCLRNVPTSTLQSAVDKSPDVCQTSLHLAWWPRADGVFLTDNLQQLVLQGSVANIPFITGNNDDEGTAFACTLLNITDGTQFKEYMKENYLPTANSSTIDQVVAAYPDDVTQGSPFDTGGLNALTPEYKRLAAIEGDFAFQAPRRFFIGQRASKQPIWSFLNKRLKSTPNLGSYHGSDLTQTFDSGELQDYLIHFVNNLDPNNGPSLPDWPQYLDGSKQLLTLLDGLIPITITTDNFREDAMDILTEVSLVHPL